jgi:hypothetical protein
MKLSKVPLQTLPQKRSISVAYIKDILLRRRKEIVSREKMVVSMDRWRGKVAIVTGASARRAIGSKIWTHDEFARQV